MKTKTGALGTLVAGAVVVGILSAVGTWPGHPKTWRDVPEDDQRKLELTIGHIPPDGVVEITHNINGSSYSHTTSERVFSFVLVVRKTDRVTLVGKQQSQSFLTCSIKSHGVLISSAKRRLPGEVVCRYPS